MPGPPLRPSEYFADPRRQAASLYSMAAELREDAKRKISLAARLESVARVIDSTTAAEANKEESARLPRPSVVNPRPKNKQRGSSEQGPLAKDPLDPTAEPPDAID